MIIWLVDILVPSVIYLADTITLVPVVMIVIDDPIADQAGGTASGR